MCEVQKILIASTAHIKQSTARLLEERDSRSSLIPICYPKDEYGWFFPILPDSYGDNECWPDDLLAIRSLAVKMGCTWIMLDRDADLISGLKTWDW